MKKIPTVFERDWNGDKSRVVDQINPAAQWVFDGEGVATIKIDGTSCMMRGGKLFKRREVKAMDLAKKPLPDFEIADHDMTTDKITGWVPVGDGPEDKYHREAFSPNLPDGTYELMGPKVQGNPDKYEEHTLVNHEDPNLVLIDEPLRTFGNLKTFLGVEDIEGLVFHHPDGRMAKIKGKDFGFKRS